MALKIFESLLLRFNFLSLYCEMKCNKSQRPKMKPGTNMLHVLTTWLNCPSSIQEQFVKNQHLMNVLPKHIFSNKLNQFKFIFQTGCLHQTDLLRVLFFHDEVVLGFVQPVQNFTIETRHLWIHKKQYSIKCLGS